MSSDTKRATMTAEPAYDPDVGRPKKRPEDKYETPPRSYRPPPELYARVKRKAARNRHTLTGIIVAAFEKYDREHPDPHDPKETR